MLKLVFIIYIFFLTGCSMFYMNALRKNETSIKFVGGETRSSVIKRLGKPLMTSKKQDTFRIRGRLDTNDFSRVAGGMTAFTLGLGEIILFPYVLLDETVAVVADNFCVDINYDQFNKASGYKVYKHC